MAHEEVDLRLGSQLWCERDDTAERVDELVARAAEVGFGQLRVFLMWPWIQPESPQSWDWRLWDDVFDAASRHSISVKATLTANSGPWWLGTGSVLHSHTLTLDEAWLPASEAYVLEAVRRYSRHPALGQWILWNEPSHPFDRQTPAATRPVGARELWSRLLASEYEDVSRLNIRWRTGFGSFGAVPFVEDLVHPAHRSARWHSWRPYLDDAKLRAELLEGELERLAALVRSIDNRTPLCINPNQTFANHVEHGLRLGRLAGVVDTLGASFHAPWSFADFAQVDDHASLVVAGVRLLRDTPGAGPAEVTEVQTGNTFYAGVNPLGVGRAEIAATYLAPLLAGAESVTGWCFNTRRTDFEAAEWGLLDDEDRIGERARSVTRVRSVLASLDSHIGKWAPAPVAAAVIVSESAHALQFAMSLHSDTPWSTRPAAGMQGAALAAVELERLGVPTTLVPASSPLLPGLRTVLAIHVAAWEEADVEALLAAAASGATVVIDATTGQFDSDATLHRPWPGHLAARTGMRSRGLETAVTGRAGFDLRAEGRLLGPVTGVRSDCEFSQEWSAVPGLAFALDSQPVLWQRAWGEGRLVYSTVAVATSLVESASTRDTAAAVLARVLLSDEHIPAVRPLSPATTVLTVTGPHGHAHGVFAPEATRRSGESFAISLAPGHYRDLWSGDLRVVGPDRLLRLTSDDGIALLVPETRLKQGGHAVQ